MSFIPAILNWILDGDIQYSTTRATPRILASMAHSQVEDSRGGEFFESRPFDNQHGNESCSLSDESPSDAEYCDRISPYLPINSPTRYDLPSPFSDKSYPWGSDAADRNEGSCHTQNTDGSFTLPPHELCPELGTSDFDLVSNSNQFRKRFVNLISLDGSITSAMSFKCKLLLESGLIHLAFFSYCLYYLESTSEYSERLSFPSIYFQPL